MSGFLFAFLACLLASPGARDQMLLAQIGARQGQRPALLAIAVFSTLACCAIAVWFAHVLASELPGEAPRTVFAGLALAVAGGEGMLLPARKAPQEPTQSLFAAVVVLAALQVTDAVRFVVLGLALVSAAPQTAAMGGAAAGIMALGAAWLEPGLAQHPTMTRLRRVAGFLLLATGLALAWHGHSIGQSD